MSAVPAHATPLNGLFPCRRWMWDGREVRDDPVVAVFAQQALYADLLVLGQHDPEGIPQDGVPFDFVEYVMAMSGKPTLVLPYAGFSATLGETVVIAWRPTREAARAVATALPLLQRARRVYVLAWSGDAEQDKNFISGDRLNLTRYLQRFGVTPTWHLAAVHDLAGPNGALRGVSRV